MHDIQSRPIEASPPEGEMGTVQLAAFIEALEMARLAYREVLKAGINRTDQELAADGSYRQLLQAGLCIYRLGGGSAVRVVSESLGRRNHQDGACHLDRLWSGLLPLNQHHRQSHLI